ncbi:hypothetical protein AB4Z01_20455 [Inquilinus sp. YAF38]|uniref:hypothetical protein n=1 Tax=Inquilinus sp. YAF38 TaxID=3233084 RepID=UPI003F91FD32
MGNPENERGSRRDAWSVAARSLARHLGVELKSEADEAADELVERLRRSGKDAVLVPMPQGVKEALQKLSVSRQTRHLISASKPGEPKPPLRIRKQKLAYHRRGSAAQVEIRGPVEAHGNIHVSKVRELAEAGIITIRPPRGGKEFAFSLIPVFSEPDVEALPKVRPEAFRPQARSDAILRALKRGREMVERDLEEAGGTYSTREVAQHLGISPQAVHKQVQSGKLLSVPDNEGNYRFPAFQLTRPAVRPHLPAVLGRLKVGDPFIKLHWLLTRDSRLGSQRPVDLLDRGDVDPVLRAAEEYGEHVPA